MPVKKKAPAKKAAKKTAKKKQFFNMHTHIFLAGEEILQPFFLRSSL